MATNKTFDSVVDSGERQSFDTGSKRDTDKGKGNPSLIPTVFFQVLLDSHLEDEKNSLVYKFKDVNHCYYALEESLCFFAEEIPCTRKEKAGNLIARLLQAFKIASYLLCLNDNVKIDVYKNPYIYALRRLAIHYQNGAVKYDRNNWRKGQPISRYYDSTKRHLWSYAESKDDEDHLAAVLWNIVAMIVTITDVSKGLLPESLFDFPYTFSELSPFYDKSKQNKE